jgi:hypothetical protein
MTIPNEDPDIECDYDDPIAVAWREFKDSENFHLATDCTRYDRLRTRGLVNVFLAGFAAGQADTAALMRKQPKAR